MPNKPEPPMNSKLRDILHRMARYYEAVALRRTPPNKTDFATAEKAIRKAVADEMLELVGDNEYGNIGYDGEEMFYRNQFRAELRQKINEWEQL